MSKFIKVLVALLAAAAIATPAFAIEADFGGFLQVRGIAFDNMDGSDTVSAATDDSSRGVDSRYRLFTNTALNENVKAVFAIEIDYAWGDTGIGDPGADAKEQIEVKDIYLDFNLPEYNTNIKAGTHFYKLGRGILFFDDNSGLTIRTSISEDQSLGLYWAHSVEGDIADDDADADYYHLQYDLENVGGWHIAPYVAYADLAGEFDSYYLGLDVDGKIGDLALSATLIGNDWENDDAGTDGNGLVAWAKATYKMGATSLLAEAAYYGDEDNGGRFLSIRSYNNFAEIITGGRFDGRGTVGSNQTVTSSTVGAPYTPNWLYGKLGAEHKYEKSKVSVYYIYAEEAEDTAVAARTMGHEIDGYYDYTVTKGLTFTLGGAYLVADDDFGAGDDAWKLGTALTYKF